MVAHDLRIKRIFFWGRCAQNRSKIVWKIFHCPCLEGCATRRNSSELISNFTNYFLGVAALKILKKSIGKSFIVADNCG